MQEQFMSGNQVYQVRRAMETSKAPTFTIPCIYRSAKYIGAWAMGIGVVLNLHQDLADFLWSDTRIHMRGIKTERVLAYFCFPMLGIAVLFCSGDNLLFNPAVPHMIISKTHITDNIYCVSLYIKTY